MRSLDFLQHLGNATATAIVYGRGRESGTAAVTITDTLLLLLLLLLFIMSPAAARELHPVHCGIRCWHVSQTITVMLLHDLCGADFQACSRLWMLADVEPS